MSLIGKDEPIRIAIVGAGISGIAQAIRLKQDLGSKAIVTIYEREWRAGGVWRDSQWAGAGVDIPIHLYSLYSDLNPNWKSVYASQPEVLAYWESLIEKHGIRNQIQYNSKYIGSTWLEDEQAHAIIFESSGADKDRFEVIANVLISATGPLAKPVIPDIPGRELFKGASFHNLRWDSNVQLDGKRVAVLGNGSSGIQLVPGVAARPGVELIHFIRSGGYFLPKVNSDFSPLALWAFKWFPGAQRLYRNYLFFEAWVSPLQWPPLQRDSQKALQDRLLKYLEDKAPAEYLEALTPDYPVGCKRVAYDAGWLDSLHRKNVELVRDPVVRISETGLHTASGRSFPVDVIGSDVPRHGLGLSEGLKGQDGVELKEYWESLGGPEAYLGLAVPGFPNYFVVLGPNASAGFWGYSSGNQTAVISRLIKEMVDLGLSSIHPKLASFEKHNKEVQRGFESSPMISSECTNWYRVGRKVVVPNSTTGVGLWWKTRKTRWSEWNGTRRVAGTTQLETVNLARLHRKRQVLKLGFVTLVLSAVGAALYVVVRRHQL